MARQLEYLGEALGEAESAASWYAEQSPLAAAGFARELDAAIVAIEAFPEAWPSLDHRPRRYVLRRFPFSVVYRVEATRILVVAVAHGHRRPGYWTPRLPSSDE